MKKKEEKKRSSSLHYRRIGKNTRRIAKKSENKITVEAQVHPFFFSFFSSLFLAQYVPFFFLSPFLFLFETMP
jgi:hypothetical protein